MADSESLWDFSNDPIDDLSDFIDWNANGEVEESDARETADAATSPIEDPSDCQSPVAAITSEKATTTSAVPDTAVQSVSPSSKENASSDPKVGQQEAFWHQFAMIFNSKLGFMCSGTYEELTAGYPELEQDIIDRFQQWLTAGKEAEHDLSQQPVRRLQEQHQNHPGQGFSYQYDQVNPSYVLGNGGHMVADQNASLPAFQPARAPTADTTFSTNPVQYMPLLETVPKDSSRKVKCIVCKRTGPYGSTNDGRLCTRCFNRENAERNLRNQQAGYGVQPQSAPKLAPATQLSMNKTARPNAGNPAVVSGLQAAGPTGFGGAGPLSYAVHAPPGSSYLGFQPDGYHRSQQPPASQLLYASPAHHPNTTVDTFEPEHESVEAARAWLRDRAPGAACKKPKAGGDDPETVRREQFYDWCGRLYAAVQHPAGNVPTHFDDAQKKYWVEHQSTQHVHNMRCLETPDDIKKAKARVMIVIDEILSVHEHGVPKSDIEEAEKHRGKSYPPNMDLSLLDRLKDIVKYVEKNKYISRDVLKGTNLVDLVRSPYLYNKRKMGNVKTNNVRKIDLGFAKDWRDQEQDAEQTGVAAPKKRGRKAQGGVTRTTSMTSALTPPETDLSNTPSPYGKQVPGYGPPAPGYRYATGPQPYPMSTSRYDVPHGASKRTFGQVQNGEVEETPAKRARLNRLYSEEWDNEFDAEHEAEEE